MKKLITLICLSFTINSFSQQVAYIYDNAGNRVQRMLVTLPSGMVQQNATLEQNLVAENSENVSDSSKITDRTSVYEFNLYPNPTVAKLTVVLDSKFLDLQEKEISIFDDKGTFIKKQKLEDQRSTIDLSNYSSGKYFLRINAEGFSHEWLIVKQ